MAILMLGCGVIAACSGSSPDGSDRIERQRRSADRRAIDALLRAQDAYHQGDYRRALVLTDSAGALENRLADVYSLRGHILTELRRFREARENYRRVLELAPGYGGTRLNLANLSFRQGRYREAIEFYREEIDHGPSARAYNYLGRSYQQIGMLDSARWAYQESIRQDSAYAPAYMRLGQHLEDEGRLREALAYSEQGLARDSSNADFRYIVGSQRYRVGRIAEAIPLLRSVVREHPDHHGAHYNLGQALLRAGRVEEAERYLERADSLEEIESEFDRLRSVAESNSENVQAWLDLGAALRDGGEYREALRVYEIARSIAPSRLVIWGNIADLHQRLGHTGEAIIGYRRILERDSTVVSAWFNLGVLYANANRPDKAQRAWRQVLRYRPDHPRARTYLERLRTRSS